MAVILDPENKKRAATRRTRIAAHQHGSRLPSVHSWGCVGGLGDLATLLAVAPPKGPSMPSAVRNYADPQHFCRYRGYDSAWVPGTMLGARVGRPNLLFWIEPWPHRASVVPLYYETFNTARPNSAKVTKRLWIAWARRLLPARSGAIRRPASWPRSSSGHCVARIVARAETRSGVVARR